MKLDEIEILNFLLAFATSIKPFQPVQTFSKQLSGQILFMISSKIDFGQFQKWKMDKSI